MELKRRKTDQSEKEKRIFARAADIETDRRLMEYYYPRKAGLINALVTDCCDRLDYEGSFIYDEYPDRGNIERICRDICSQAEKAGEIHIMENRVGERELLGDFIGALVCQEIHQRRCRRKLLHRLFR